MRKRMAALLLALALVLGAVPRSRAVTLWFVSVNETIPLTMTGDSEPFYSGDKLYIPYTAFNANPGNVVQSYNVNLKTLSLFTRYKRLVYNLATDTVTDEDEKESSVKPIYRNGVLFIPADCAAHFGLSVSLLYSASGYPVLRFKTGSQVYTDEEFIEHAENVITYRAENTDAPSTGSTTPGTPQVKPPNEPEIPPVTYYLAFHGEGVSEANLNALREQEALAAFYLTEAQILQQPELVRAIYEAGHTIGVTLSAQEAIPADALRRANEALDRVIFCKTLMAMLQEGQILTDQSYMVIFAKYTAPTEKDEQLLILTGADESKRLEEMEDADATFKLLRENTKY